MFPLLYDGIAHCCTIGGAGVQTWSLSLVGASGRMAALMDSQLLSLPIHLHHRRRFRWTNRNMKPKSRWLEQVLLEPPWVQTAWQAGLLHGDKTLMSFVIMVIVVIMVTWLFCPLSSLPFTTMPRARTAQHTNHAFSQVPGPPRRISASALLWRYPCECEVGHHKFLSSL